MSSNVFISDMIRAVLKHIVSYEDANFLIKEYYEKNNLMDHYNRDLAFFRISILLGKKDKFALNPKYIKNVHYILFNSIVDDAGCYRQKNISKREECLHARSVIYSDYDMIEDNLTYDLNKEQQTSYYRKSTDERSVLLSDFVSHIWQAHPFSDGNTRTDMVFLQKYLDHLELDYDNRIFDNNFTYFRNALVRSNYNTIGFIEPTDEYLNKFMYNLLTGKTETLDIRETYVPEERMIIKHQ